MSVFFVKEDVKSCLPNAAGVLVYDRWIDDVSVALDAQGTVMTRQLGNQSTIVNPQSSMGTPVHYGSSLTAIQPGNPVAA